MFKGNKKLKYILIYGAIVAGLIISFNYAKVEMSTQKVPYSQFKTMLNANQIQAVEFVNGEIKITPKKDTPEYGKTLYAVNVGEGPQLINQLEAKDVKFGAALPQAFPIFELLLYWVGPLVFFLIIGKLMFGKMDKKMGGGVMSFGKNNAKLYAEDETGKTFDDVAGQEEAKESLKEIVEFLHDTDKYVSIGAKLPKGALLVGPPGTGKTLLAKAVAGEAKVPFFSLAGSDFVEMFVGMGASRVRDLFKQAAQKAPCIIFIDEIDAIGKSREGSIQGNDEREQTLNQLLTEMDGFDGSKGVVILAATNRPEVLDKALLRAGRFDRRVIVDKPDFIGREAILRVHTKEVKISKEVSLEAIAKSTPGAVGADLANIVNEAALRAVKHGRKLVIQEDLEDAAEMVIAGKEKKDTIMNDKELRTVAYHEVGHALVAAMLNNTDPVHKITIVPRTMGALGYTMQLPEEEKYLLSKDEMIDQISVMFGGRSAEEVEFGRITTGASNDIERATQTARNMVTVYGMSDRFDMMGLESASSRYMDGRNVMNCSAATATIVDEEVLKIIKAAHKKAVDILTENKDLLDEISSVLLDKETIMGDEFLEIVYAKYPEKKEKYDELKKEKEFLKERSKIRRAEKAKLAQAREEERRERIEEEAVALEALEREERLAKLEAAKDELDMIAGPATDKEEIIFDADKKVEEKLLLEEKKKLALEEKNDEVITEKKDDELE
ncbi:ATP-dependent zinc metalloprotease FtsH [uncultured Clostridium sp.]|jgi:cell division protease FtsH|uniref:ATP-dependent zinc metalloprotease FtsH n=1 Tax=uncultured Clostridium sp. TaxID=59620 RepID=UPI00262622A4|nr:ATP-dependent zinc metalloprotease FtsH [uncultured Clostridium sp.]